MRKFIGVVVILFGVCVYLYPFYRDWKISENTNSIIRDFEDTYGIDGEMVPERTPDDWENTTEKEKDSEESESESELERYEPEYIPENGEFPHKKLYYEMVDYNNELIRNGQHIRDAWSFVQTPVDLGDFDSSGGAIGYIDIPDMEVRLPLYIGASEGNMALGAAVLSETSMPVGGENTNCVISGHRGYGGSPYFRNIENMSEGSLVYLTNPWGTMVYRCVGVKVIEPTDFSSCLIWEGRDMITLLTCHPYMSHGRFRYLVYCERDMEVESRLGSDTETEGVLESGYETNKSTEEVDSTTEISKYLKDMGISTGDEGKSFDISEFIIVVEDCIRYVIPILCLLFGVLLWKRNRDDKN